MSTIKDDFDRIALATLASEDGAAHNDHYHNLLLRHLPSNCNNVLEIGCGTGNFARRLAEQAGSAGILPALSASDRSSVVSTGSSPRSPAGQPGGGVMLPAMTPRVLALDLSPEMIRIARERSTQFPHIDFELADIRDRHLPDEHFDCIASIATLHHLPLRETLTKMKAALKPGGVLLILDLFEREGLFDSVSNLVAIPVSVSLRLLHQGRLRPSREVRAAWAEHERHDIYPTMSEVYALCASLLPGAKIRKHLLWRYSVVWHKPA